MIFLTWINKIIVVVDVVVSLFYDSGTNILLFMRQRAFIKI